VHDNGNAVRVRAFELSLGPDAGTPEENWARAERELAAVLDLDSAASDYDTIDRDLERLGIRLARLPGEAAPSGASRFHVGSRSRRGSPGTADSSRRTRSPR